ncbi:MAG: VWA domain-containing protein [Taibaiella sp.]|nr:VWA domain-containing protein [Taibaiella sp.]
MSVLVLILAYSLYKIWLKRNVSRLGSARNVRKQLIGVSFSNHSRRMIFIAISLSLMVLALMNIRKGSGTEISDRKGLDIIVALDVSKSMLARDLNPNRLDRSKVLIQQLMQKLNSDRVGFIIFAGNAYLQSPITSDYNAVRMMLETATPDAVPTQGTVLGEAIELARKSFNQETNKYKVILLISDGEDHDASALNMAEKAKKEGVVIYTVGVGSPQGAYIIEPLTGQPKKR